MTKGAKCRGCGTGLNTGNDSAAHVIPNALGGRLKPKGLLCQKCNTELDDLADNALVRAFGDWPTLLDIPRDHGRQPPKVVETRNGRRVRVEVDGSMTAVNVVYDVQRVENGDAVEIAAGDIKTMRQLLRRAQKQFPQFDPVTAEKHLKIVGIHDGDELRMRIDASPQAVFGGVVSAAWLFVLAKTGHSLMDWEKLKQVVKDVQTHGGTFRYLSGLPGLVGPEIAFGHKVVVRSTANGQLIAFVELCGVLKVGGIFAKAKPGGPVIEHIYAYDLKAQKDRSSEFSITQEFDQQDWQEVGIGPSDGAAVRELIRKAQEGVLIPLYASRFNITGSSA